MRSEKPITRIQFRKTTANRHQPSLCGTLGKRVEKLTQNQIQSPENSMNRIPFHIFFFSPPPLPHFEASHKDHNLDRDVKQFYILNIFKPLSKTCMRLFLALLQT